MTDSLFHGSGETVTVPEIRASKYTKDFGTGFYCTKNYTQAVRWAERHDNPQKGWTPKVNIYGYTENPELSIKVFTEMTEEWLDFIAHCRNGGTHNYDIVEGPMADDEVWQFVDSFLEGTISREAFWVLAQFKKPTHQISFHTEAALHCLTFEKVVEYDR